MKVVERGIAPCGHGSFIGDDDICQACLDADLEQLMADIEERGDEPLARSVALLLRVARRG